MEPRGKNKEKGNVIFLFHPYINLVTDTPQIVFENKLSLYTNRTLSWVSTIGECGFSFIQFCWRTCLIKNVLYPGVTRALQC